MLLCSLCRKYASAMVEYAAAPRQGQLGETGLNATTPPSSLSTIPMLQHTGKLFDNSHGITNKFLTPMLHMSRKIVSYFPISPESPQCGLRTHFSPCSHISLQRVCPVCLVRFPNPLAFGSGFQLFKSGRTLSGSNQLMAQS